MSADMNKPIISGAKPQVAMNANTFQLVIKRTIGSWIETITREAKPEDKQLTVDEIQAQKSHLLMRQAEQQKLYNDNDPKSRATFNIVI